VTVSKFTMAWLCLHHCDSVDCYRALDSYAYVLSTCAHSPHLQRQRAMQISASARSGTAAAGAIEIRTGKCFRYRLNVPCSDW